MPLPGPIQSTILNDLLEHIRRRGIPVSTLELQRLQHVFATAPNLSRLELCNLLCTLLAKDHKQRWIITRIFDQMIPYEIESTNQSAKQQNPAHRSNQTLSDSSITASDEASEEPIIKPPRPPLNFWKLGLAILFVLIAGLFALYEKAERKLENTGPITVPKSTPPIAQEKKSKPPKNSQGKLELVEDITLWTPEIIAVKPLPIWRDSIPPLLLLLGGGIGFSWLLQNALQRTRKRRPLQQYILKRGRSWLPALKKQPDYHLLSSNARREMSWGIDHYLSEQPLTQLDIPRSVTASAKSGLPSLHFQTAQQEREVWLWQDRSSTNPDLIRLADEISNTLQKVNMPIQQGYFHALPSNIINQRGEVIWSTQHEYPENQPLVVVLSDNDSLSRIGALQTEQGQRTLQQLSHWEHLCIVDCSPQLGELCRLLSAYSLECLSPQEVSLWLARQGELQKTHVTECKLDDLHQWAIACALPDRPLMEAEVRALHERLGLECAWKYHQLKRYARASGNGFDFSQFRYTLLQELAESIPASSPNSSPNSSPSSSPNSSPSSSPSSSLKPENTEQETFIKKVIHFWQQRYKEIDQLSAENETPQRPWKHSRRQHMLKLESALLGLWQKETLKESAETLYDLHQDKSPLSLKQEVEQKLAHYTCFGWQQTENTESTDSNLQKNVQKEMQQKVQQKVQQITLPHDWHTLPIKTRQQLKTAGLGGTPEPINIAWNKTTGLILGALAGITLVGLFGSIKATWPILQPKPAEIKLVENSLAPKIPFEPKLGKLTLGDPKTGIFESTEAPNNHIVTIRWEKQILQAAQFETATYSNKKTALWRLGTKPKPQRLTVENWPDFSIAIIGGVSPQYSPARKLAARLLDTGTADQVVIGKHWQSEQRKIAEHLQKNKNVSSQWLYINTRKPTRSEKKAGTDIAWLNMTPTQVLAKTKQEGIKSVNKLSANKVHVIAGNPRIQGKKKRSITKPVNLADDMKLMPIQKGSFQMGSNDYDSEKPIHTVSISNPFYISQTEVTFKQYDAYIQADIDLLTFTIKTLEAQIETIQKEINSLSPSKEKSSLFKGGIENQGFIKVAVAERQSKQQQKQKQPRPSDKKNTRIMALRSRLLQRNIKLASTTKQINQLEAKKPNDEGWGRDNRPVINVSWDDAQAYVKWLSKTNSKDLICRLPTEAEWEYVARAGLRKNTNYSWGNEIGKNKANCDSCGSEWDGKQTAPVGSFKPNAWGVQDMHGNVWEWVQDCYTDDYSQSPSDGSASEKASCARRVLRGGSWLYPPDVLRSAYRVNYSPVNRNNVFGFRVVCSLPSAER